VGLICIDLEASGLSADSYPIEVAWKDAASGEQDSFMIDPASVPGWDYWDEYAEELHGLDPERLARDGITADAACRRLSECLADRLLVCDAYDYDLFWLRRLFDSQALPLPFRLCDVRALLTPAQMELFKEIQRRKVRRHRAMNDVDDLIAGIQQAQAATR